MATKTEKKNINEKSKLIFEKANKIHLELLSLVQNELNGKKRIIPNINFYSSKDINEIIKEENKDNSILNKDSHINEQKSNDTSFNSDEEGDESSSDMSCNDEFIINL